MLGETTLQAGQFGKAERLFRACLAEARRLQDRPGQALALHGLGQVALAHGEGRFAAAHFRLALQTISGLPEREFEARLSRAMMRTIYAVPDGTPAIELAERALALAPDQVSIRESWFDFCMAQEFVAAGAGVEPEPRRGASNLGEAALGVLEVDVRLAYRATALEYLFRIARRRDDPSMLLAIRQLAQQALPQAPGSNGVDRLRLTWVMWVASQMLGDLAGAELHGCDTVEIIERQYQGLRTSQESRAAFLNSRAVVYTGQAWELGARGRREESFDALERLRGRLLLESVLDRRERVAPQHDREYERLQRQLALASPAGQDDLLVRLWELQAGIEIMKKANALKRLVSRPGSSRNELEEVGSGLYDLLLRPLDDRLAGATRLVICPDPELASVPFAALFHRTAESAGARPGRFLGLELPITHAASFAVFHEVAIRPRTASTTGFCGFADPQVPEEAGPLGDLPGGREETARIAAMFGREARTFVGDKASEDRFRDSAGSARYLHLACHGLKNDLLPLSNALVLGKSSPPRKEDGLLRWWEVFSLSLDTDLVSLSACDTASGRTGMSEGQFGLGRAFLAAGARSVVSSLWEVPDHSDLMVELYRGLRGGQRKDEALRDALRKVAGDEATAHPYYWASWQLFGDGDR